MKTNLLRIILSAVMIFSFSAVSFSQVVPIFRVTIREDYKNATLLGGVENGKWLDRKTTFGKLKDGEKLTLFNFDTGKKEEITFGTLKLAAKPVRKVSVLSCRRIFPPNSESGQMRDGIRCRVCRKNWRQKMRKS